MEKITKTNIKKYGRKYVSFIGVLGNATLYLVLGLLFLVNRFLVENVVIYGTIGLFVAMGMWKLIEIGVRKDKTLLSVNIFLPLLYFALALAIFSFEDVFINIFPWLLVFLVFVEGIVKIVSWYLYRENRVKHRLRLLLSGLISLFFAVVLIFNPVFRLSITYVIIGVYFVLQAILLYMTAFSNLYPQRVDQVKGKFRLALPVVFAALIPMKALREINESFSSDDLEIANVKKDAEVGVEVLVHMSERGFGKAGHVDLIVDGTVISYGSYDKENYRLGAAIGDGLIFQCKKEDYVPFVKVRSGKTLMCFGIHLSVKEKELLLKRIEKVMEGTYEWFPLAISDPAQDAHDYSSDLYRATGARFYKFHSGPFKTYFVLNTNCVQLADYLLGAAGINLINPSGIVTPGTYMDFLEKQYEISGTPVITRTIYR